MHTSHDLDTITPTAEAVAQALGILTASGQFKTLRIVQPPHYLGNFTGKSKEHDIVAVVDCEATSGDPETACPIELGATKLAVHRASGKVVAYLESLSMLEDPGVPSLPGAQAVHGIAPEALAGKKFDSEAVQKFLWGVDYVVAHNAGYDRPVLSRRFPVFDALRWVCSMREVNWAGRGCSSRALEYLLFKACLTHNAHRALADAEALAALLSYEFPATGTNGPGAAHNANAFMELGAMAYSHGYQVIAVGAEFDAKDIMKARGYRWNSGDGTDGTFKAKAWSSPVVYSEQDLDTEIKWLAANAYQKRNWFKSDLPVAQTTARTRHTLAQSRIALNNGQKIQLGLFMERQNSPQQACLV